MNVEQEIKRLKSQGDSKLRQIKVEVDNGVDANAKYDRLSKGVRIKAMIEQYREIVIKMETLKRM